MLTLPISIHAPRTGSDRTPCSSPATRPYFNPRSPHGERRATTSSGFCWSNFNPRSPHGERPCPFRACARLDLFQSTLPARGATCRAKFASQSRSRFQSTLPARGATTRGCRKPVRRVDISIHAPRTGSDGPPGRTTALRSDFNPRSPHGERPERNAVGGGKECLFQSTLPARGATKCEPRGLADRVISIHAPRTGSDASFHPVHPFCTAFQSTLPARGATRRKPVPTRRHYFNPRSPHGERLGRNCSVL